MIPGAGKPKPLKCENSMMRSQIGTNFALADCFKANLAVLLGFLVYSECRVHFHAPYCVASWVGAKGRHHSLDLAWILVNVGGDTDFP